MSSRDSELAVIGGLLVDPVVSKVLSTGLTPEDFSDKDLGSIYGSILKMHNESMPIDIITVRDYAGDIDFNSLASIANNSIGSSNIGVYARHIRDSRINQDIETLKRQIEYKNYQETVEKIHNLEMDLADKDDNSMKAIIGKTIEYIDNVGRNGTGLSTGLVSVDSLTNGLRGGSLIVLAGRPSMGKSTFAINIANNISKSKNVLFFSLEMSQVQLMLKIVASDTRINQSDIDSNKLSEEQERVFYEQLSQADKKNLSIVDTGNLSVRDIIARSRKANGKKKIDCIVIDYLQIMKYNKGSEVSELGAITRELKYLSKELDIPIILLSQLSRGVEQRENKRPLMSDLRASGEIEQDADVIMMVYRDEYYNKEESTDRGMAEIIVAKNRMGTVGWVKCRFEGQYSLFSDDTLNIYDK